MVLPPEICPCCGADVPRNALACPACGADERTGWSDEARYEGLDLPDESFDYDEFVEREFGGKRKSPVPTGIRWYWWLVAALLVAVILGFWVF